MGSISSKNVGRSEKCRAKKHQKSKILKSGGSPRAHIRWKFIAPPPGSLWKRSQASRTSKTGQKRRKRAKNVKIQFLPYFLPYFSFKGMYFLLFGFTAVVIWEACKLNWNHCNQTVRELCHLSHLALGTVCEEEPFAKRPSEGFPRNGFSRPLGAVGTGVGWFPRAIFYVSNRNILGV